MIRWHRLMWCVVYAVVFGGVGLVIKANHASDWWFIGAAVCATLVASDIAPSKREGSR